MSMCPCPEAGRPIRVHLRLLGGLLPALRTAQWLRGRLLPARRLGGGVRVALVGPGPGPGQPDWAPSAVQKGTGRLRAGEYDDTRWRLNASLLHAGPSSFIKFIALSFPSHLRG